MSEAEREVAEWMLSRLKATGCLYQDDAVSEIEARFGENFVYDNANGNRAISRKVLDAFNLLTTSTVVWERGERYWRFRVAYDEPGRSQD